MLFLVLFVTLSLGFYAATSTSVQVASNARHQRDATYAAESALQFVSYHLGSTSLPPAQDLLTTYVNLCAELRTRVGNTMNVSNGSGGFWTPAVRLAADGTRTFVIPDTSTVNGKASYNWMRLGDDMGKAVIIVKYDLRPNPVDREGPKVPAIVITALGRSNGSTPVYRALQYDLKAVSQTSTGPFLVPGGAILSRSPVTVANGIEVTGNVTAVTGDGRPSLTMSGGAKLTGVFSYVDGQQTPSVSNGAKLGPVHVLDEAPPFPTVDTTPFAQFVPAVGATGTGVVTQNWVQNTTLTNVRIKANANTTFNNVTLQGVVYVESPNKVSFGGSVEVNGVIVTDNNPAVPYNPTQRNNVITVDNSARLYGVGEVDMTKVPTNQLANVNSLKQLFASAQGVPVAQVTGSLLLAPNYRLVFAGGTRTYEATMVGAEYDISNGYRGNFNGALINLGTTLLDLSGGAKLTFSGSDRNYPGLVTTTSNLNLSLDRSTYSEVDPWTYVK
jgi:Tfp pilus assembly protein PilX